MTSYLPFAIPKPITSPFGWRIFPFPGFHNGVDFGSVGDSTPIFAVEDGVISFHKDIFGGLYVWQNGREGSWIYLHLSKFAPDLSEGFVKKGEFLGFTGSSGLAFGPHLHLGYKEYKSDKYIDPIPVLNELNNFLSQREMDAIMDRLDQLEITVNNKLSLGLQPLSKEENGKLWVGGVYDATEPNYDALVICNYADHTADFTIGIRGKNDVWTVYGEGNKANTEPYLVAAHSSRIITFPKGFGTYLEIKASRPIVVMQRSKQV